MLDEDTLPLLTKSKNLLAFSAGLDSTALFFLLRLANIEFDIALVNYHTREQSDAEADRARQLAEEYGLRCFIHDAPKIDKNFEAEARAVRYAFFDSLIETHGYDTLLTAHQLNDRLEWFLMRLSKGAGLPELLGMEPIDVREKYTLLRPLLGTTKTQLQEWLSSEGIEWFEDVSNTDTAYERNRFRHLFADPMLESCSEGIGRSFAYLDADRQTITPDLPLEVLAPDILFIPPPFERIALVRTVDRWLKGQGVLMPGGERERLMYEQEVIVARRYAVGVGACGCIVAPHETATLPKPFREQCREAGIPPSVRPALYGRPETFERLIRRLREQSPTTL